MFDSSSDRGKPDMENAKYESGGCCAGNSYDKEIQRCVTDIKKRYKKDFTYVAYTNLLNNIQAARKYLTDHEETTVIASAEDHDLMFELRRDEILEIISGKIQAGFAAADACMDGTYVVRVHTAVLCGQLCRLPEIEQEFRKRFPYIKKVIADPDVILYSTVHKALKILCG